MATSSAQTLKRKRLRGALPQTASFFPKADFVDFFVVAIKGVEQEPIDGKFGPQPNTLVEELRLSVTPDFAGEVTVLRNQRVTGGGMVEPFVGDLRIGQLREVKTKDGGNSYITLREPDTEKEFNALADYVIAEGLSEV